MLKISLWLSFLILCLFVVKGVVFAQSEIPLGVATYVTIIDKDVPDGSIISFSDGNNSLSKLPYDPSARGVVATNAAIIINNKSSENSYPLLTGGTAMARVTTSNGAIKKGDLVAPSAIPGVGMKATELGWVVGSALEDYTVSDKNQIGKIPLLIGVHNSYVVKPANINNRLFDVFKLGTIAVYESPVVVFKYIISAVILITSIIFAFVFFGRIANSGVEALGRNPLASRFIQVGIALNVLIALAIIGAGIAMAYFVIK